MSKSSRRQSSRYDAQRAALRARNAAYRAAIVQERFQRSIQRNRMAGRSRLRSARGTRPPPGLLSSMADNLVRLASRQVVRLVPRPVRAVVRKIKQIERWSTPQTFRPVFSPEAGKTVCDVRKEKREVMFARKVAGKRWGRGGPSMKNARRSEDSNVTCRR